MADHSRDILKDHYKFLGLKPGAGASEIERAYREMLELYQDDSDAVYGLCSPEELREMRRKVEESYTALMKNLKIHDEPAEENEKSTGGVIKGPSSARSIPKRRVVLDATQVVDGRLLAELREKAGLSLEDIHRETKVATNYLRAIEANDPTPFPARVYLAGFVKLYAKALGIDPDRAARDYLEKVPPPGREKFGGR